MTVEAVRLFDVGPQANATSPWSRRDYGMIINSVIPL